MSSAVGNASEAYRLMADLPGNVRLRLEIEKNSFLSEQSSDVAKSSLLDFLQRYEAPINIIVKLAELAWPSIRKALSRL